MAISIDWATKVITIPKADTALVDIGPPEIRSLNVDTFRKDLNGLQDSEFGMAFETTHIHTAPVTIGGVTLARVVEIINGYTVTFEDGFYAVNLEGANQNIGDVLNFNSVQVRSSNSAGLTFSKQVEDQTFTNDRVHINTLTGQSGTAFPLGTPGLPVNNLADAQAIITARTLPKKLFLRGDLTIGATDDLDNYDVLGASAKDLAKMSFTAGASTDNLVIADCEIDGITKGPIVAKGISSLNGLNDFEGSMFEGGLQGTISLTNTVPQTRIEFIKCFSQVAGETTPIIDCDSLANLDLNIRGYHGGITIRNFSNASMLASVDLDSGHLVLEPTCSAGTIVVRGVGNITDNSTGTTVITAGFVEGGAAGGGLTAAQDASLTQIEDILEGDHLESYQKVQIFKKGTVTKILDKDITGSLLTPGVTIRTNEP